MRRCRTVRRLKSQRAGQLSSLMPGAVWSYDSCSDGTRSKTRRRSVYNAEKLEGNQRQQILVHKKPLCSIVLRHMFPLMGGCFKVQSDSLGPGPVLMCSSLQCPRPNWRIQSQRTVILKHKLKTLRKYSKVDTNRPQTKTACLDLSFEYYFKQYSSNCITKSDN